MQECLSDRKDLQISFLHCGGTVKHVQVCLNGRKDRTKQFSPLWRSCETHAGLLCARNDRESRFHHCGGLVKLV